MYFRSFFIFPFTEDRSTFWVFGSACWLFLIPALDYLILPVPVVMWFIFLKLNSH